MARRIGHGPEEDLALEEDLAPEEALAPEKERIFSDLRHVSKQERDAGAWAMMVRKAHPSDLDAIERIESKVFEGDRLSRRSLRHFVTATTALMLVLVFQDRVLGYSLVGFRKGSARARLYSIALDPTEQGHGLGRLLLGASERAAKAHGAAFMRLEVRADNAGAIALYRQNGYRIFGRYEQYYEDGGEAIRFEKALATESHPS